MRRLRRPDSAETGIVARGLCDLVVESVRPGDMLEVGALQQNQQYDLQGVGRNERICTALGSHVPGVAERCLNDLGQWRSSRGDDVGCCRINREVEGERVLIVHNNLFEQGIGSTHSGRPGDSVLSSIDLDGVLALVHGTGAIGHLSQVSVDSRIRGRAHSF